MWSCMQTIWWSTLIYPVLNLLGEPKIEQSHLAILSIIEKKKKKDLKLPQWRVTFQMDCMKIRFFPDMKGALNPWHRSPSRCTKYLKGPLPQGRSTHWNIRRRISRAHVAALFMCLESEWESLGWIATHPNPLSNNVRCGGRINLFFVFSCFLAIVITLRLSYIGAWALKASPAWRNTKKKGFRKFLFLFFSAPLFLKLGNINNCSAAGNIT